MSSCDDAAAGASGTWNSGAKNSTDRNTGSAEGNWDSTGDQGMNSFTDNAGNFDGDYSASGVDAGGQDKGDSGCRNCGQEGHFARECSEPKKMGACFNCGEEGHTKAECTKARVFKGTCNSCGQEDKLPILHTVANVADSVLRHAARDCPTKPKVCKNCLQEGHETLECKNKKVLNNSNVADKTEEEAWAMLKQASDDKDLDDFKDAVKILTKAVPEHTYPQLENEFRKRGFKVYIIAMEKDTGDTWTNVDLQGEIGKKYAVAYYFSDKPQRPNLVSKWPASAEENMERLADAGIPMDRGVEKCSNCGELGHTLRKCLQDLVPIERATVSCALCGELGHRVRDCTQERQKPREPRACRVCEATDHIAKDCPNRPKQACHKCGDEGHKAADCEVIKCFNCDAIGHESRDCTAPKDWSRVKCRNCGEFGHGTKRCKVPPKEDENAAGGAENLGFDTSDTKTGGGGGWDGAAATTGVSGNNDWENAAPVPVAVAGGW